MNDRDELGFREVRPDVPLTDADFASIRKSVLARIEESPRKSGSWWLASWTWAWRTVAAVMVVAAVLAAAILLRPDRTSAAKAVVRATVRPAAPQAPARPLPAATRTSPPSLPTPSLAAADEPVAARSVRPTPRPRRGPARRTAEMVAASHEPITLELHTSSPDIRIIWIAR